MPMTPAMSGSNAMKRFLLAGFSMVALAGCTVGPTYHKPQVKAPATWRDTQPPAESRVTTASTDPQWWKLFQ
ncbi:Outer membrane component of tripartite multidrug resistance system [Acetobacter malorum]|uniref:Outer membrane component of tripartite multidrug resistance system n=1 Tax=Acetobacter malorum TaxID=178901 RepID=A0A177GB91_9PROT|nr:Outer membrane component of tripartite multidrug resistance system [Acetobacter malorum]